MEDNLTKTKTLIEKEVLEDIKKNLFDKNNISFLVVGSLALQESGFDVIPHDIDIEAICTEEQEKILSILSASCGNNYYEDSYRDEAERKMENVTWKHKPFIFKWRETLINVWAVDRFSHPYFLNEEGIKIAKPVSVLKKKMAYGREKDHKTLNGIVKQIINFGK